MSTITTLLQNPQYDKKVILEKLVCHALEIQKEQLFTEMDRAITDEQMKWIDQGYTAYTIDKKPLEYILGWVAFLGYRFQVSPATLIPRPETEYMIEAVNEYIQEQGGKKISLMDIGTGCGVLGLSVLLHNRGTIQVAYLTDLSAEALEIVKRNYATYQDMLGGVTPRFLEASLLDNPFLVESLTHNPYVLVANLPYIPEQLFEDNTDIGVKKREPKMAFVGGDDGLDLYREMFDQLIALKNKKKYVTHDAHILYEKGLTWKGGHIPYKKALQDRAKELRKNMTKAEKKLWYEFLKDLDMTVNRQKIIDGYIMDFYIASAQLVIEVDGDTHYTDDAQAYDRQRTQVLEQYDIRIIRYTNKQIYDDFDAVCEDITKHIEQSSPALLGQRREDVKPPLTKEVPTEEVEDLNSTLTMFLEMMTRQVDILRQEYENAFTFEEVKTFHFNIRIIKVKLT